ncbi:hypothetical protein DAEQUDRAFT_139314 [Daedalea quercina L-15889]|uniref:Uncharacterized protein n=1 Tax=Daedalea quercina L-15889 TaxID=1314783 RepID=A0A165RTL6_9APHY|nr:hypothetical protein DAEQUDRAFT_139314 [Daedalea quercina L-15889]
MMRCPLLVSVYLDLVILGFLQSRTALMSNRSHPTCNWRIRFNWAFADHILEPL